MNQAEATHAVAYLNAGFPRDTLEPESFAIWVGEVMELPHAASALDAAKVCVRQGDRFPTIKEFRTAYRQAFDRHMAGRELEAPDDGVPPPPEAVEAMRRMMDDGLKSVDDLPATERMPARPVWARHERREAMHAMDMRPSDAEIHDAIIVLRDHDPRDETYVGAALHREAQQIMDDCTFSGARS